MLIPNRIFSFVGASALAAAVLPTSSFAAVLDPIGTTGYDQDVVFEAGLTDGQVGANGEFGSRQFFEAGVFADGLPPTTNITSVLTGDTINFAFQPFTQNNILKFDNATGLKTLTLTTPAAYTQLAIVHSGGSLAVANEVALLTYTINYAGGETQTGDLNVVDWGAVPTLPSGTERFLTADRTTANATIWPVSTDNNTTANRWAIYLSEVTPTRPDLNIESITFGPVSLSNSAAMTITALIAGDDAVVFGLSGELANIVVEAPTITNQPASITVSERQPATFSVGASGSPLAFHWHRDGTPIAGAKSASYTIPSTAYPADDGAQFQVIVSNSLGVVTSVVATLAVNPDTNGPTVASAIGDLAPNVITVNFSEPLEPSTVSEGSFSVYLTGTIPHDGLVTQSYLMTNNNMTVIITTDPREFGSNYSIRVIGVRDSSSGQNPLSPDPTFFPVRSTIQLININEDWKYDINNGDRFGTGWESVAYDDSSWPSGPAPLGLDADGVNPNTPPIATPLPYGATNAPTYFRRHFLLPSGTNGVILTLRDIVEDGAVYFINGQEAFRHNVSPGILTFATRSTVGQVDPPPIQGPFNLPTTNLVQGDNVIAVVVVQSSAASTDLEFAAELTAIIPAFSVGGTPGPRLNISRNATTGEVTVSWTGAGILQQTISLQNSGTVFTDVPGNPNPHVFTPPPGTGQRFFSLRP